MKILIVALALSACASTPAYREPTNVTAPWIHPTMDDAIQFSAEHTERLCITEVPDGFQTEGC